MTSFVTSAGFTKKSLAEIRADLEAEHRIVFGSNVDLAPEGPLGQSIAISSKYLADTWEGLAEVYAARDPDTATGIALDEICAETGITRLEPTSARASSVYLWMTYGTAVSLPIGSKIKAASSDKTYSLESAITGKMALTDTYMGVRYKMKASYATGEEVVFTFNNSWGAHMVTAGQAPADVATALATILNGSGIFTARSLTISGSLYLEAVAGTAFTLQGDATYPSPAGFDSSTYWQQALTGNFTCDDFGAVSVPALSLDTIATPVSGWLGIYQPVAGTAGTDTETDTELRLRRLKGLRSGTATEDAIYNAVYRVEGVTLATVTSNRSDVVDADGRDPHSFEVVVEGGDKNAIAQAIWNTSPAGIKSFGSFTGTDIPTAVGADGKTHEVNFSVPTPLYAWVEVTVTSANLEEVSPDDLISAIKEAVTSWGNTNMGLGDNLILQKFYGPVFTVKGIGSVNLQIATSTSPTGAHTYDPVGPISIDARHYASFAVDRVEVLGV